MQDGPTKPNPIQCMQLTHELHDWFKEANGKNAICCPILTREFNMGKGEHKAQCIRFTGPGAWKVGQIAFRFGFVSVLALLVLVTLRYIRIPGKEPAKPLFCIYAAPVSLCLAGYVPSVPPKAAGMVIALLIASTALLIVVLCRLPMLLRLKFYPRYAAFPFPFVIAAIAAMLLMACLNKPGMPQPWLKYLVVIEAILATVLVCDTLARYLMAICKSAK